LKTGLKKTDGDLSIPETKALVSYVGQATAANRWCNLDWAGIEVDFAAPPYSQVNAVAMGA